MPTGATLPSAFQLVDEIRKLDGVVPPGQAGGVFGTSALTMLFVLVFIMLTREKSLDKAQDSEIDYPMPTTHTRGLMPSAM